MEFFNRALARDPNRKVSWDQWPVYLGVLYLISKIRFNRSNALTDPYDYAANDTKRFGAEPEPVRHDYTADGSWVSDRENPQMGAKDTRFGSNIPPRKVPVDIENMTPSAREAGKLRWRRINPETGKEIVIPALILNNLAGWWIQFQSHNFVGNTKHDPIGVCPHHLARSPQDNWPGNEAIVDRTSKDTTRVTGNGRPTPRNEREQAWMQGQIYGSSEEELRVLRLFESGKMRLDSQGHLPEDPDNPGIDKTGFSNNYSPGLSLLHWLFVREHNDVADYFRCLYPDWDDEKLFQMARKTNVALVARIHTIQWTEDLLQHPALQIGMHADWYGMLGQRRKLYLMRLFDRHPTLSRLCEPLRRNEFVGGMPGSKWEHHDGPFQVPKHFRMVYRLHEMNLSEQEIYDPASDRLLDRIQLLDFVHHNTRPVVARFGYEALAWSFVKKSAGALKLHNFPRALTQFQNQLDGTLTDLAERDIFRERTDGTGSYNEFRLSVGEPEVTSFMELTGGDAELAREVEIKYEGDISKVDAGIGILCEPKPAGFALSFTQFYQFVLNAPRRVKSNRHLTDGFTYAGYAEGMNWVEHSGGILGVLTRHLPALRPLAEGVLRGFAPWPETETFPRRLLEATQADTGNAFKSDVRTFGLAVLGLGAALWYDAVAPWTAVIALLALAGVPTALAVKRMLATRFMQQVWNKCYTDKRGFMFGTLTRAEQWINRAATFGKLWALVVIAGAGAFGWAVHSAHPLLALVLVVVALSGIPSFTWSNAFAADAAVLKIALRNRMREGQAVSEVAGLPGATALQKRYWFLKGNNEKPVATFSSCMGALIESGLPAWTAFGTTVLSLVSFGPKTQHGLSEQQKREAGLGMFDICLPNIAQAESYSSTRVYAPADNRKGLAAGELDMDEFDRMFRLYAPGRDCLTAYDFERMGEGNRLRDAREGRGTPISRLIGRLAGKRRTGQLLLLFADRVVEEDRKLVPAISRDMLLRFYQGSAQYDLMLEHQEGDRDPSPVIVRTVSKNWRQ
ncbi:MAG: peroxidase family protein [Xanthobacteraceae bacterium]